MQSVIEIWQGVFGIGSWQRKMAKIENGKFRVYGYNSKQLMLDLDLNDVKLKFVNNNDLEFVIYFKDETYKFRVASRKILSLWRENFKKEIRNKIVKMRVVQSMKNIQNNENNNLIHDAKIIIQHKAFQKILIQMQKLEQIQKNLNVQFVQQNECQNENSEKFLLSSKQFTNECQAMMNLLKEEISCLENMKKLFLQKINDPVFIKQLEKNQYKTALEQLIQEKSLQDQESISQISLNDSDSNDTIYYSLQENSFELQNFKQHFKNPLQNVKQNNIQFSQQGDIDDITYNLITNNKVFVSYPIQKNQQKIRNQLARFREKEIKLDLWKLFKDNIGKDLTKITMPVYFNEPLSLLQKNAEAFEYKEYFNKANQCDDVMKRMAYVTAGIFMKFGNIINRVKKPFNPLLGETYEYQEDDFKLIMEQVCHHPPILCYHAENNDFVLSGYCQVKLKFSLKGFSVVQLGQKKLYLKRVKETYDFSMPESSIYNIIVGETYIWHVGKLVVENLNTNVKSEVQFLEKGWSSKDDYKVYGSIKDSNDVEQYSIEGYWNKYMQITNIKNKTVEKIIERNELPENAQKMYNFTKFAINLNNITEQQIKELPPTDCRFRPDLRAYEYGDIELAASEKHRLEENQRKRRQQRKDQNIKWQPLWFDFEIQDKQVTKWNYKNEYWQIKQNGNWPKQILDLYNQNQINYVSVILQSFQISFFMFFIF